MLQQVVYRASCREPKTQFVARGSLVELERDAHQSHNAAGGDKSAGVERAGRNFTAGFLFAASGLEDSAIDHRAHDASVEHGERGSDGEIGSDSKGERANTKNFNGEYHED